MPKEASLKPRPSGKAHAPWVLPIPKALQALVNGSQKLYYQTEREGLDFARELKKKVQKHGTTAAVMGAAEAAEIGQAKALLNPFEVSILDAVKAHVEVLRSRHKLGNRSVIELADDFLAHTIRSSTDGPKSLHVINTRYHMKRFKEMFGGYLIADLTRSLMTRALAAMHSREMVIDGQPTPPEWIPKNPLKKESVNGFHRYIAAALEYAVTREMLVANPMAKVSKLEVPFTEVSVFTPTQTTQLFQRCPDELVLYFAIGAFAGLRPTEIERHLKWKDISFEEKTIFVDTHGSRTYRNRFVPIRDNLLPLLLKYRGREEDFVCPLTMHPMRDLRDKVCEQMGFARWPQDVLRHSFCSYNLKLHPRSVIVDEMGHRGPDMIEKRYRNPRITLPLAQAYCTLDVLKLRAEAGGNIVQMPKVEAVA